MLTAEEWNKQGIESYKKEDYENAIKDFTQALALDEKNEKYWHNRGIAYSYLKDYENAIKDFTQALMLNENDIDYWYNRGIAYSDLKDYENAIKDFTQALVLDKNDVQCWHNRGVTYGDLKDYENSIKDFTQALVLDENYVQCWHNRGIAYNRIKDYENAIKDFTQALVLDENYVQCWHNRGIAYNRIKDYENAIKDYTQALMLDGKNDQCWYNRGVTYGDLKDYENAIKDYTQALVLDGKNAQYWYNRGVAYSDLKDYENAIKDYTQALVLDGKNDKYWSNRGIAYNGIKDYENAIKDFTQALVLDENDINYWYNRGVAYGSLKDYENSIKDFTQALVLNENDDKCWYNRGVAHNKIEDYNNAIKDFTQALVLNENDISYWYNRGVAYDKNEDHENAIKDFTQALVLDENDDKCWCNRGVAYNRIKDYENAIKDFTQALVLDEKNDQYWHNRGIVNFILGNYDKALIDVNQAINLNPNGITYWLLKGDIYNLLLQDITSAQENYYRGIYLHSFNDKIYIIELQATLYFFTSKIEAPYLVKQLARQYTPNYQSSKEIYALIQQVHEIDKAQHYFAYQLSLPIAEPSVEDLKIHTKALTDNSNNKANFISYCYYTLLSHYYNGDPVMTYRLCDELFELDQLECLNISMQYYFVRSAYEILSPEKESILKAALIDADKIFNSLMQCSNFDIYYSGQIYYLANNLGKAKVCFEKSKSFPPSAFMLVLLHKESSDIETFKQNIQSFLKDKNMYKAYLYGLEKTELTKEISNSLEKTYQYAHYSEISKALELVREYLNISINKIQDLPFYEIYKFKLSESDEKLIREYFRKKYLEGLKADLLELLKIQIQKLNKEELEKEIQEHEKEEIRTLFDRLSKFNKDKLEKELGLLIHEWKYDHNIYTTLIQYSYLQQQLDIHTTFTLHTYIDLNNARKAILNEYQEELGIDLNKKLVEYITALGPVSALGTYIATLLHLPAGIAAFGSFVTVGTAAIFSRGIIIYINKALSSDLKDVTYERFKENFLNVLDSMAEDIEEDIYNKEEILLNLQTWTKENKSAIKNQFKKTTN
ncbi:tetratricopeptide repeat protein [Xanthocytophaga agilis]|uniref:Tetratricopeptide repeat protein n=1 Tax=Xanthocytophaga agilis TaxID=3048010 RepID=A0AAE3RB88_9BACT|nr:tetratricopeptide repeat protein [Xanthocytophaga agilis]MDJ1504987.1 tetratricopeptide repeat protein [Xanthocytophaga agilis]